MELTQSDEMKVRKLNQETQRWKVTAEDAAVSLFRVPGLRTAVNEPLDFLCIMSKVYRNIDSFFSRCLYLSVTGMQGDGLNWFCKG